MSESPNMTPVVKSDLQRFLYNIKQKFVQIANAVLSVNGTEPDTDGDIHLDRVDFAGELESSSTQNNSAEYIMRTSGGEASVSSGEAWLNIIRGRAVHTGFVQEVINMTVNAMERDTPITATIDNATFKEAVTESGTITLTYTTEWSANPVTYGVTVTGTPVAGDQIVIVYVKGERGTITVTQPTAFISTGWNLYNHAQGYARVLKYSDDYGFRISGTYTALQFAETVDGTRSSITVTNGNFTVPSDGYVFVTGGNSTDTAIWMTWSDWTESYPGDFSTYFYTGITLSGLYEGADAPLPYGLLQCGTAYDEVNLNVGQVISRIDRMEYTAENLATAQASGREYDADENYIYIVRATPISTSIEIDGGYSVNDHGLELFEGTTVPVYSNSIYGSSLKNKLERDVLTISQQTLNSAQQSQVRANLDVPSNGDLSALGSKVNRLNTLYSLVMANDASSDTTQTFNTYNSRKFSDYRQLIFVLYVSSSSRTLVRNTLVLPSTLWTSGKAVQLIQNHGISLESVSGIQFAYYSDTSVRAFTLGAGQLTGFEIYGYPNN